MLLISRTLTFNISSINFCTRSFENYIKYFTKDGVETDPKKLKELATYEQRSKELDGFDSFARFRDLVVCKVKVVSKNGIKSDPKKYKILPTCVS